MGTVITTTINHGDVAYWKEHGISVNSLITKHRVYPANSIQLNLSGQVPHLGKLSFLFYKTGSWEDQNQQI